MLYPLSKLQLPHPSCSAVTPLFLSLWTAPGHWPLPRWLGWLAASGHRRERQRHGGSNLLAEASSLVGTCSRRQNQASSIHCSLLLLQGVTAVFKAKIMSPFLPGQLAGARLIALLPWPEKPQPRDLCIARLPPPGPRRGARLQGLVHACVDRTGPIAAAGSEEAIGQTVLVWPACWSH